MAEVAVEKAPLTASLAELAKPEVKEKLAKMKNLTIHLMMKTPIQ